MNIPANYKVDSFEFRSASQNGTMWTHHYLYKKGSSFAFDLLFIVCTKEEVIQHVEYYKYVSTKVGWKTVTKEEFTKVLYHTSLIRLI